MRRREDTNGMVIALAVIFFAVIMLSKCSVWNECRESNSWLYCWSVTQ